MFKKMFFVFCLVYWTYLPDVLAQSREMEQFEELERLEADISRHSRHPHYPNYFIRWCDDVKGALDRAEDRALSARSLNQVSEQRRLMVQGLRDALRYYRPQAFRDVLAAKALVRGVRLSEILMQTPFNADRTTSLFLTEYYSFLRQVINSDREFSDSYFRSRCFRCRELRGLRDDFEQKEIDFAKNQIELVLNRLASVPSGSGWVGPVGSVDAFLKTLQKVVEYAFRDLRASPFSYQYACVLERLDGLHRDLKAINEKTLDHSFDPRVAVNEMYFEALDITQSINEFSPHRSNPYGSRRCS